MKNIFARYGNPETLVTDNGLQFTRGEMSGFAAECDFQHITSSPYFPQSNGEVESAVQIAKRILMQPDQFKALQAYRATPVKSTGVSPAELLMGRKIRTSVPSLGKQLDPEWPDLEKV